MGMMFEDVALRVGGRVFGANEICKQGGAIFVVFVDNSCDICF